MIRYCILLIVIQLNILSLAAREDSLAHREVLGEMTDSAAAIVQVPLENDTAARIARMPTETRTLHVPPGWFFLLNVFLLVLLVVKFIVFQSYSRTSWNAWINENLFYQLIREKAPVNPLLMLLENLLKIYLLAALLLLVLDLTDPGEWLTGMNLLLISGVLLAFFLAKLVAGYILAFVTDQFELFKMVNLNAVIFSSNSIYFLIPLILIAAYLAPPLKMYGVYLLALLTGIAVIFLVFRALRIFIKARIPFNLQFFLYLCGLEILPYLFLAKVLETKVVN